MLFTEALSDLVAQAAYLSGICGALFVISSYLPLGLVCGAASVEAGLTTGPALALPLKLGLIAACMAGLAAGLLTQSVTLKMTAQKS